MSNRSAESKGQSLFSPDVEAVLKQAGWYPGRRIGDNALSEWARKLEQSDQFRFFDSARLALQEFGYLKVDRSGPGVHRAKCGFEINPLLGLGEKERFFAQEREAGTKLFPLGEVAHGQAFLAIGENGAVFLIMEGLVFLGPSIHFAIENMLEGRRPERLDK